MKHLDYGTKIKESPEALHRLYCRQKSTLARRRLRFLLLLKSGQCQSQASAGHHIGIKQRASEKLWKHYLQKGLAGLLAKPRSGRPAKLDEAAKQALEKELANSRVQTLRQACDFVLQNHGISLSPVALHYYFKAQKIKKKTGRPTSVRKDVAGEVQFKKKYFLH